METVKTNEAPASTSAIVKQLSLKAQQEDNEIEGEKLNVNIIFIIPFLIFFIFINDCFTFDNEQIPNGQLEVAYRQLTEGKLSDSVHNVILSCFNGQCSMTTLTVNQCFGGKSFYPAIQRTSTKEGNLKISIIKKDVIEAEEGDYNDILTGVATFKYRFTYTTKFDSSLSELAGIKNNLWFKHLTGFSGAVVKQSEILNKVISWELVPLKGSWVTIKPDCNILLRGVPQD